MTTATKGKSGFTLIELLVVISILGFIASGLLVAMNHVRANARDARRVADFNQVQKALEYYYDATGAYPNMNTPDGVDNWNTMISVLVAGKYMAVTPDENSFAIINTAHAQVVQYQDPLFGTPGYQYEYLYGGEDGRSYRMRARLENINNPALLRGVSGGFLHSSGEGACDRSLRFYCVDGGSFGFMW